MFESKSSYKHPLAIRIADSATVLESYAQEISKEKRPYLIQIGSAILSFVFPSLGLLDKILKQKNIRTDGSLEEKIVLLIKSAISDRSQLLAEYEQELLNKSTVLPAKYEKPIEDTEVVKSNSKLKAAIQSILKTMDNQNIDKLVSDIVPETFVTDAADSFGRLQEYFDSLQSEISTRLNQNIPEYLFQLKGEYWKIRFGGETIRLKDSKGLQYIKSLLQNPRKTIRSDELVSPQSDLSDFPGIVDPNSVHERTPIVNRPLPDVDISVYRDALAKLESELKNLNPHNKGYLKKIEDISTLKKIINRRFNLFGKRRPQDSGEKARQAVLKAISRDTKRVKKDIPDLYWHFERYIKTGFECIYDPPTIELKSWQF
jgi:hypothetical protein